MSNAPCGTFHAATRLLYLLCGSALWGCAVPGSYDAIGSAARGNYQRLEVTHRFHNAEIASNRIKSLAAPGGGIRQVAYTTDIGPEATDEVAEQSVVFFYPHPDGRRDVALAGYLEVFGNEANAKDRLSLGRLMRFWETSDTWATGLAKVQKSPHAAWVLDIPKTELDRLLAELEKANREKQTAVTASRTHIRVNAHTWRNSGPTVQSLEEFAEVVKERGQLVSMKRNAKPGLYERQKALQQAAFLPPGNATEMSPVHVALTSKANNSQASAELLPAPMKRR